ncbi:hypothetical protein phiOC_p311 [Ochrobactrum phage vB_OspM_OC]|nr:hypothetical protein phiOC_p311 [Ochrobactrum phage vB_OspM_OC]
MFYYGLWHFARHNLCISLSLFSYWQHGVLLAIKE